MAREYNNQRWFVVRNIDIVALPAYGIVQIINTVIENGETVWEIKKPLAAPSPGSAKRVFAFLWAADIPPGSYGEATQDCPAVVLYDTNDVPVVGERWGVRTGETKLFDGDVGFIVTGAGSDGTMEVKEDVDSAVIARGTMQQVLNPGGAATCLLTTGQTVQVNAWTLTSPNTVPVGTQIFLVSDGAWYAVHDLGASGPVDIVRATADATFFRGGTVAGTVVDGSVQNNGTAITLFDYCELADDGTNTVTPRVPSGTKVIAAKFGGNTQYYVLSVMDRQQGDGLVGAYVTLSGTLSAGGTATARKIAVAPNGDETDTGINVTVVDKILAAGSAISNGAKCYAIPIEGGAWAIVATNETALAIKAARLQASGSDWALERQRIKVHSYAVPVEQAWDELVPIEKVNHVFDLRYDTTVHALQKKQGSSWAFKVDESAGWTNWTALTSQVVVTDPSVTTDSWVFAKETVWVLQVTAADDETIPGTAC